MKYKEEDIMDLIEVYEREDIVTRDEFPSIDLRSYGRGLEREMKKRGFDEATYTEGALENYADYSGVLFNSKRYSEKEAIAYLCKEVLKSS